MPGNKQSGMKEEPEENTKKRGNMKMKTADMDDRLKVYLTLLRVQFFWLLPYVSVLLASSKSLGLSISMPIHA